MLLSVIQAQDFEAHRGGSINAIDFAFGSHLALRAFLSRVISEAHLEKCC